MWILRVAAALAACAMLALAMAPMGRAQDSPDDYLTVHNLARSEVYVEPLEWDEAVAASAFDYANQRIGDCSFKPSNGSYGENIFVGPTIDFTAIDAVESWVSQKASYDHENNSCVSGESCLSYTQVVWQNSLKLGCARVECHTGGVFVTCHYDPAGNIIGEQPY